MIQIKEASIYIHIPFCTVLCPFCDFYKRQHKKDEIDQFIDAACQEIQVYKQNEKAYIPTIFFGGGTPSVLTFKHIQTLLKCIENTFDTTKIIEKSIEINPEDVSKSYLESLKKLGFTRISLGVQTFNNQESTFLGRAHTVEMSLKALSLIKTFNFTLSIDLLYGLPNSSWTNVEKNILVALSYDPDHVSIYCLTVEENTVFYKKGIRSAGQDIEHQHLKKILSLMNNKNYIHYEVCSFAKKGKECLHNKRYWDFKNYIGIGPSAHSLIHPYRFYNPGNFQDYLRNCSKTHFNKNNVLTKKELISEHIIANLRKPDGINIKEFNKTYNISFHKYFKEAITIANHNNWIQINDNYIKRSKEGLYLLDELCLLFV